MGKIRSAIGGRIRGSIGSTVFSIYRGVTVARERPARVANPRTQYQMEQRAKITGTSQILAGFGLLFKSGLTSFRVLPLSARRTRLTHRSAVSQQLMQAMRDDVIPLSEDKGIILRETIGSLDDRAIPVNFSRARPTDTGLSVQIVEFERDEGEVTIKVNLQNASGQDIIVNNLVAYTPIFASSVLADGIVGSAHSIDIDNPIIVPASTSDKVVQIDLFHPEEFYISSSITWWVVEATLRGIGIVATQPAILSTTI